MNASMSTTPQARSRTRRSCLPPRPPVAIGFSHRTCLPASAACASTRREVVRQRDVHHVDVGVGQQLVVRAVGAPDPELGSGSLGTLSRARDTMATTSQRSPRCIAGITLRVAMSAHPSTPHRSHVMPVTGAPWRGAAGPVRGWCTSDPKTVLDSSLAGRLVRSRRIPHDGVPRRTSAAAVDPGRVPRGRPRRPPPVGHVVRLSRRRSTAAACTRARRPRARRRRGRAPAAGEVGDHPPVGGDRAPPPTRTSRRRRGRPRPSTSSPSRRPHTTPSKAARASCSRVTSLRSPRARRWRRAGRASARRRGRAPARGRRRRAGRRGRARRSLVIARRAGGRRRR